MTCLQALEKAKVTDQVKSEIFMISNFITLCDYIIMEYLVALVIQDFSKFLATLQIEKSTVFSTSVMFDNSANIQFTPNCETVKSTVLEVMKDTVHLLNSLPHLAHHVKSL